MLQMPPWTAKHTDVASITAASVMFFFIRFRMSRSATGWFIYLTRMNAGVGNVNGPGTVQARR